MIIVISFSLTSCLKNSVVEPNAKQAASGLSIGLSMKKAASDVASIVGVISRQGFPADTSVFVINNDSATCTFSNVPAGSWLLQVNAYGLSNTLAYTGSTDVQVLAGEVTPVSLTLNPAADSIGSVGVVVTWSGNDSTDMAMEFDGVSGHVVFAPNTALQPSNCTVEFRVWFDTSETLYPLLAPTNANCYNTADGYTIREEYGSIGFGVAIQSNLGVPTVYQYTVPYHVWVHIAGTYDQGYLSLYIDGQLVSRTALTSPIYYGNHGFSLGMAYNSFYYPGMSYFKGAMDELRIWNYARSQAEIDSSMNSKLTGKEPGLVGYWNFDQNASDTYVLDRTGNGNNGELVGGVRFVPKSSFTSVLTGIDRLHR